MTREHLTEHTEEQSNQTQATAQFLASPEQQFPVFFINKHTQQSGCTCWRPAKSRGCGPAT